MRILGVDKLKPGLVVGRPVVDEKGAILLHADVVLNDDYINRLKNKGFSRVYIKDPEAATDIAPDEDLDPVIRGRAITAMQKAFDIVGKEVPNLRKDSFDSVKKACGAESMKALMSPSGPFADTLDVAGTILGDVLNQSTLTGLTSIKSRDTELHNHSIDVCVVAIMIAQAAGQPNHRLRQLATGCLLHDIGKIFLDPRVPEQTRVRQHTLLGYEILKNSEDPDILSPHVALEHHERQDGQGEPRGLTGSNRMERDRSRPGPVPTLIGEIAAVANIYDNLLSGTASRPPMTPDAVIQAIRMLAGTHLNRAVVSNFLRVVPVFPLGAEVIVRNGDCRNFSGIVARINQTNLDRPVILLTHDRSGHTIEPAEINLADEDCTMQIRCKW